MVGAAVIQLLDELVLKTTRAPTPTRHKFRGIRLSKLSLWTGPTGDEPLRCRQ